MWPGLIKARYQGRKAKSEQTSDKHLEVLAEHSTDVQNTFGRKGGETMPKRPTAGKVKPGVTFCWEELQEALRGHKLYNQIPVKCIRWQTPFVGSTVMRPSEGV